MSIVKGISQETLEKVGAITQVDRGAAVLRLPVSEEGFVEYRSTNGMIDERSKVSIIGKDGIFGRAWFEQPSPIAIVGSELNALAVMEAGGNAIAIGRRNGIYDLLKLVQESVFKPYLVIAIEDVKAYAGIKKELIKKLIYLMADFEIGDLYGAYDSAYNALQYDPEGFYERVRKMEDAQPKDVERNGNEILQFYLDRPALSYFQTGFKNLDSALGGGLVPGLTVLGAIPSLGKTTFCLQMACQMAAQGRDVFYFILESTAESMLARILSRMTYQQDSYYAATYAEIRKKDMEPYQRVTLDLAIREYQDRVADHLYIIDGECTVEKIKKYVKRHRDTEGTSPVVIIDYLQYLQPAVDAPVNLNDKQVIDRNLRGIKEIAKEYEIPVVAISSWNRESFYGAVAQTSNNGSSQIDYLAETSIALTYDGMPSGKDDIADFLKTVSEQDKAGKPTKIKCSIVKGRDSGQDSLEFDLIRKFYYVMESGKAKMAKPAPAGNHIDDVLSFKGGSR